ncbi:MAG: excinuclease ABC subunit UvrC [Paludibacteraceae bacterium]|nr:excinuclease ABC subunit UvrC [Paludibacteraceae bacterium]MBN2787038.1 excinuclease ABC subunit UvrC [Paludibacteraceae bacterium]
MSTTSEHIKSIVSSLPEKPGVYQYYNNDGIIIYVGKAKNLKKRVSSYFNKEHDSPKTRVLVKQISSLKYIVVNTEEDALLLENNLIKKYQPRYNALLKDDKTYPSICIKKERFPRIFKTRNLVKDGSEYFGPYSSVYMANTFLEIIREIYQIRTCNLPLTKENIRSRKFKVCLQYHIKNCKGPCENLQTEDDYMQTIQEVRELIKGNVQSISDYLLLEMKKMAAEYRFEEAQRMKEKYELIEKFKQKSVVVNQTLSDIDVFSFSEDENAAYINILRIVKGAIVQGFTIEYKKKLDESKEDLLSMAIIELRQRLKSDSKEILVPFKLDLELSSAKISVPQRGDKLKLLELSLQNVRQYKLDKLKQQERLNPDQRMIRILSSLQKNLQLKELPLHIECFDNSNISGSDAVAACVVFKKAKPAKKEYRKYTIKTVVGPDDYESLREVVRRRYRRILDEATPLPNLIIADGGVGHMEAIRQVLQDELKLTIPIAGLAKDNRHKTNELLIGFPPKIIGMKATDELYKFLASIQEEVHRFAITFHREKRSKSQIRSELDEIKGIGEKSKNELLKQFKSVKRIRMATLDELIKIAGKSRASTIYSHFNDNLTR